MSRLIEFTTEQAVDWLGILEQCAPYDFYHLPQYHALAEELGEGSARLLVYREGDYQIVLPILLRSLDALPAARAIGPGWMDATSVYGYPGPIASSEPVPPAVIANFQQALLERLRDWRVVTVFSRLNPLLPQRHLVAGLGEFFVSQTVSIDLTEPVAVQRSRYRRSFKDAINKLRRLGLTVVRDAERTHLDTFVEIYHETMCRVDAAERYFFPPGYFQALSDRLGSRMELFMGFHQGQAVCGGLLVACHGVLQYHLGGTRTAALCYAPMKLLVDEARLWACSQGLRVLHLGGGATPAPDDPLLFFKRGFSDRLHEFAAWRWIIAPAENARLCAENARQLAAKGLRHGHASFFPAYRCPATPSEQERSARNQTDMLISGGAP